MVIEKSVELGVTDFHPVLTHHCDVRKLNTSRIKAQIKEAAEQCERLTLPKLHDVHDIHKAILNWSDNIPLYAALERYDAQPLNKEDVADEAAFLIGPVGGFSEDEKAFLAQRKNITPISLGDNVLRTETAVIACLSYYKIKNL